MTGSKSFRWMAWVLWIGPCLPALGLAAPPCDPALTPDAGGNGYRERAQGRCEGFYRADVSAGGGLRLTGLTRGALSLSPSPVRLASPLRQAAVQVRGIAIPPKVYYRLDLLLPPAASVDWPAAEVAGRAGLAAADLGLYGFLADDPEVHVPVLLGAAPTIRLAVAPGRRLTALYWRHAPAPDARCTPMPEEYRELPTATGFEAGREIALDLPAIAGNGLCLELAGLTAEGDWLLGSWRIRTGD